MTSRSKSCPSQEIVVIPPDLVTAGYSAASNSYGSLLGFLLNDGRLLPFPMYQTMREIYLGSTRGERGSDHHYILVAEDDGKCRVRKMTVFAQSCASDSVKEIPAAEYAAHSINGKNLADLVRRALHQAI